MGSHRYEEILAELGTSDEELIADLPGADATLRWRRAGIQAVMRGKKRRTRGTSGKNAIYGSREDEKHFMRRLRLRSSAAQMGEITAGYRMAGEKGLPEWMKLKKPERYG